MRIIKNKVKKGKIFNDFYLQLENFYGFGKLFRKYEILFRANHIIYGVKFYKFQNIDQKEKNNI